MRIASFSVLAFAFACSSSPDEPGGSGGAGGAAAGAPGTSGTGGVTQPNGGATSAGGNATNGGAMTGGAAMGGASTGGEPAGGSSGSAGTASGGASAGAGEANGGAGGASGGAGGASGGTGGGEACVKNLACKLDPPPSTGDLAQDCVDRINQFLTQCACLPALKRRKDGEACANEMAKYDADHNMAHAGIRAKICEPGGSQNSCPGYSSNEQVIGLCMQQMWDEGPPPTADCTGDCYEMYGHFINMTDDSVTQVACGFYTTSSGKVWAVQNFTR
ncbi:CAP domain-containing protein [Sorangium sp. So ce341]|uniref:CAP domain-containing protein n=1 Tax=Sorangium sp. So ce341 TaxID=3133302 RepID=UPI003F635F92